MADSDNIQKYLADNIETIVETCNCEQFEIVIRRFGGEEEIINSFESRKITIADMPLEFSKLNGIYSNYEDVKLKLRALRLDFSPKLSYVNNLYTWECPSCHHKSFEMVSTSSHYNWETCLSCMKCRTRFNSKYDCISVDLSTGKVNKRDPRFVDLPPIQIGTCSISY
jgi:hypothetical protein